MCVIKFWELIKIWWANEVVLPHTYQISMILVMKKGLIETKRTQPGWGGVRQTWLTRMEPTLLSRVGTCSPGLDLCPPGARTCSPEGGYPASEWIFRDVRMEQVLVSLFMGRKLPLGTHTSD